jgi:uncharacterized protein
MTLPALDVRDLMGHPGTSRVAAMKGTVQGLKTEVASVPDDAPVQGDLLLESIVEGILVSGRIAGTWHLSCVRCLKEIDAPFGIDITELFVTQPDEEGDEYPLDPEGFLEPEQMVRDTIGVELPFSPLCTPHCQGLCPVCGGDRNLGECPGDHPKVDPRWAELESLLEQMEN